MKLAKQFDLNMTRQHKESNLERLQNSEDLNCKDLKNTPMGIHPELAKGLSHGEELHALFDGPTQHLSGRLSPLSANCSQESRLEKMTTHGMRPDFSDSKDPPGHPQVLKPDFDDDWENDDLLHDLFVLEVPQNSRVLSSCTAKTTTQIGSVDSTYKPTMATSSSGSSSRASCSHYTRISSKTSPSAFSESPIQPGANNQLSKTNCDLVNRNSEYEKVQSVSKKQKIVLTNVCPGTKCLASSDGASKKNVNTLWGDGDDDDLLYQACDYLERISASEEQQRDKNSSNLSHSSPEGPLSIITATSSLDMSRNSKTVQSQHPTNHQQPLCVLSRSHSIPGVSGSYENKWYLSESASTSQIHQCLPQNSTRQNNYPQSRHTTGQSGEKSNHSTFKRHQSDPEALRNKGNLSTLL